MTMTQERMGEIIDRATAEIAKDMEVIGSQKRRIADLEDALGWLLPMAKGYAYAHPVGFNEDIIAAAEAILNPPIPDDT